MFSVAKLVKLSLSLKVVFSLINLRREPAMEYFTDDARYKILIRLSKSHDYAQLREMIRADKRILGTCNGIGESLLCYAIGRGDPELVWFLIEEEADVNYSDNGGYTYLHHAIDTRAGGNTLIGELLLKAGVSPEERGIHGWTPLHHAAAWKKVEFIQLLLTYGANINSRLSIDHHETPLMIAARMGATEAARALLEGGADPKLQDLADMTAEGIAKQEGHQGVVQVIQEYLRKQH